MYISKSQYKKITAKHSPKSPKIKDLILAFCVGGLICVIGELFGKLYEYLGLKEETVNILIPVTLIFISAFLTGIRVFPKIAKHAGAGTLVPITGFANAVVSPAIEFKNEGYVLGVGTKIFAVAGPVILYGTVASIIYGVIYYIVRAVA